MKQEKSNVLRVFHINDTHSYFDESVIALNTEESGKFYIKCGGFSRLSHKVKELTKISINQGITTAFFHSGDCFQGTLYFSLYKGKANSELLNYLSLDGMVLGNHEFDLGNELVSQFISETTFPILMGNWDVSNEIEEKAHNIKNNPRVLSYDPKLRTANYMIKHVGRRAVAIIGLTTDKMDVLASPDPDTPFMNAIQTAKNTIERLSNQGINNVIIVSHLGYDVDKRLAEEINGIDLIIGGHSHVLQGDFEAIGLENRDEYGLKINDTYIVQSGCHALALGCCDIAYDSDGAVISFNGKNVLLLDDTAYQDKECTTKLSEYRQNAAIETLRVHPNVTFCEKDTRIEDLLISKYRKEVVTLSQQVIGYCVQDLTHRRIPNDLGQSDIAPWVVESFYSKARQLNNMVQFALHNAGGVRSGLNQGAITYSDIAGKVLPFAIPIAIYQIKGKYLKAAIEGAIDNATDNGVIGSGSGSFPYVSQIKYRYEAAKPKGKRITEFLMFNANQEWEEIQDEHVYTGTSTAYTIKGKEGYEALLNRAGDVEVTTHSMADCFIEYLTHYPNLNKPTQNLNEYHRNDQSLI